MEPAWRCLMVLSRREPLNMQGGDGDEVLDIACEQRDAMLQSSGGGQGITHLQTVTQCHDFQQIRRPAADGCCDRQDLCPAPLKHLLHCQHLSPVTHALKQFKVAHGRDGKGRPC